MSSFLLIFISKNKSGITTILRWFNQRCQTRIGNHDLRSNSLKLMAAWIMKTLWIGLTKLRRLLLIMIF